LVFALRGGFADGARVAGTLYNSDDPEILGSSQGQACTAADEPDVLCLHADHHDASGRKPKMFNIDSTTKPHRRPNRGKKPPVTVPCKAWQAPFSDHPIACNQQCVAEITDELGKIHPVCARCDRNLQELVKKGLDIAFRFALE
jgi:hypothetical protein